MVLVPTAATHSMRGRRADNGRFRNPFEYHRERSLSGDTRFMDGIDRRIHDLCRKSYYLDP